MNYFYWRRYLEIFISIYCKIKEIFVNSSVCCYDYDSVNIVLAALEAGEFDLFKVFDFGGCIKVKILVKGNTLNIDFFEIFDWELIVSGFYVSDIKERVFVSNK
jgi:hypothetical protein